MLKPGDIVKLNDGVPKYELKWQMKFPVVSTHSITSVQDDGTEVVEMFITIKTSGLRKISLPASKFDRVLND